jgi:dTDP-4-dehydrorhamnose reductase
MKVLVTGREGQVARSLAERALGYGIDLMFVGRPQIDLARVGELGGAITAARPDVVINAAAFTEVDRAEDDPALAMRVNADAAAEAAAASTSVGARFIQLSTDYVFDGAKVDAYSEDDAPGPISIYGQTKLAGEIAIRAADPSSVIVRTAWVYSPFGKNFVRSMIAAAAAGRDPLRVVADQQGSPTSALDLADGLLALVQRWAGGENVGLGNTYHVAGQGQASWFELAEHVMTCCSAAGLPASPVQPITTADWPTRAPRPANSLLNSGRFAADIGYRCPPWRESVAEVARRLAST